MHKYSIMFVMCSITLVIFITFFDMISKITGEMFPFIGVLIFGILTLLTIILRAMVWYKHDLAQRTIEELDRIEQEENVD